MTDTNQIQHPQPLTENDFTAAEEPLRLFAAWFEEARRTEPDVANAMAVATVGLDGIPDVRIVLLKGFDEAGFVFYSHLDSKKGRELAACPGAALSFHWKSLKRQVRLRGTMELVTDAEADAYFATRPRGAQLGAHASKQSQPLESRLAFEKALAVTTAKFATGSVPRPPRWTGFRIVPLSIEFWHDRPFRLHDRIAFTREKPGAPWVKTRLYP